MADVNYESNLLSRQDQFVTEKFEHVKFLVLLKIDNWKVGGVRELFILNWYMMLTKIFFSS